MKDDRVYWLGFSAFNGIGPKRFALLKNYFGSANPRSHFLRLREKKITFKILEDKDYPENLKRTDNPPFVLYIKGELKPENELALTVVGIRRMTSYGRQVTEILMADLVAAGSF